MRYAIFKDIQWMHTDTACKLRGSQKVSLFCARNSSAAFQILIEEEKKINVMLTSPAVDNISIDIYNILPVYVEKNTGEKGYTAGPYDSLDHVLRKVPFCVYDALEPYEPDASPQYSAEGRHAFYICFRVLSSCLPGFYRFQISFDTGENKTIIDVGLQVYNVCVPDKRHLKISNWYNIGNIASRHGKVIWSEDFWDMFEQYAILMARTRQTHFLLPFDSVIIKSEQGELKFSFENTERLIKMFFKLGFTAIEGGPVARQRFLEDERFVLVTNPDIPATSGEGLEFQEKYYRALYSFLNDLGCLDHYVQHVADEPFDSSKEDYIRLSANIRRWLPNVPLIDAICTSELMEAPDISVLDCRRFEENPDYYIEYQKHRELWIYTCALPGGHYCNRLLDIPLLKTRLLHWGNSKYGFTGYLHWGFNCYRENQHPFLHTSPFFTATRFEAYLPPGDTHLVYPGKNGPIGSVRLEQMRAGVEDHELLEMLKEKDIHEANNIIESCFRSFSDVCISSQFSNASRNLLTALSR